MSQTQASEETEAHEAQFAAIWRDAMTRYYEVAGKKLDDGSIPKPTSADNLLAEIDRQQSKFTDFREKRHTLFTVLGGALKPVELVGNLAAGGASMAFPPSSLVFGAVTYLINAGHGVSASYDSIIGLFTEVKEFTTRLSVHAKQNISPELRGIVTQILTTLVTICGMSAKLIAHGRVGQYFKGVLLGKDEKIQAQLDELRRLTESEERMVGALTLNVVTTSDRKIDQLNIVAVESQVTLNDVREQVSHLVLAVGEQKKQDKNENERTQLEKIRLVLKPMTEPQDIYNGLASRRVPGTGDWVHKEPLFQAWVQREKPMLWISGGPGAGKSFLSANIIQYLTQLHPQGVEDPSRISIAYYFCKDYQNELRKFDKVLRTISYEVAQNDPVYAKYIANVVKFPEDIESTQMLWQKLFVEFFRTESFQNTLYILIDGLDEAFEEERTTFLELLKDFQEHTNASGRLRVFVALVGRPELNWDIEQVLDNPIPMIQIGNKNQDDISQYVKTSIAKIKILRRVSKELRKQIVSTLTDGAEGMFLWVDLMLKEIASKHREEQIRAALSQAPKGLSDTIRHVLERFSAELTEDDVNDLNLLLGWVTCAKRPFTLGELDTMLKIKSSDGQGMIYLEGELRKRYASFFAVLREDGRNTDDLQAPNEEWGQDLEALDQDQKELTETDTGADDDFGEDMGIVSDPETTDVTLAHSSIGDFFRRESTSSTTTVGVVVNKTETDIVMTLLKIFNDPEPYEKWRQNNSPSGTTLLGYAANYWPDHLQAIDLSKVSAEDKTKIGDFLVKMFRDEKVVMRWTGLSTKVRSDWFYNERCDSAVRRWLEDKDVTTNYSEGDLEWKKALYPNTDAELLDHGTRIAAREWLQKLNWNPGEICKWIDALVRKVKSRKEKTDLPTERDLTDMTAEQIFEAARWAGFEEDAVWHGRVARTLREAGHYEDATKEYKLGLNLDDKTGTNYLVTSGLATTYAMQKNWKTATEKMESALQILKDNADLMQKWSLFYNTGISLLGDWYQEMGDTERARSIYMQVFRLLPRSYNVGLKIMSILLAAERYSEIIELMQEMKGDIVADSGFSRLVEMCMRFPNDADGFYDVAARAARETGNFDLVKDMYIGAIKAARKKSKTGVLGLLEYWLALFYARHGGDEDRAARIWEQVMVASAVSSLATDLGTARLLSANRLSTIYYERAIAAGVGTPEAEASIRKLEQMSHSRSPDESNELYVVYSTRNSTLLLGMWYRLNKQEKEARECFKSHVKLGVDLLTDEDPENDWQGYQKLGDTLMYADDEKNSLAAWSLIGSIRDGLKKQANKANEKSEDNEAGNKGEAGNGFLQNMVEAVANPSKDMKADANEDAEWENVVTANREGCEAGDGKNGVEDDDKDSEAQDREDDLEDADIWFTCDGCGRGYQKPDNIYICHICMDIGFCSKCIGKVRNNSLGFRICNSTHSWMHVPELDRPVPQGMAQVGEEKMPISEWLASIKKAWNL